MADNSLVNHSIAIESDGGVFEPLGLGVSCANTTKGGCELAIAQLQILAPLLSSVGGDQVTSGGGGADIEPMCESGIVCAGWNVLDLRLSDGTTNNPCTADSMGAWSAPVFDPYTQTAYDSGYFWFHHSEADTMERIDPTQINTNVASLAIWAYAIAQLPELLPRNDPAPSSSSSSDSDGFKSAYIVVIVVCCAILLSILVGAYMDFRLRKSTRSIFSNRLYQAKMTMRNVPSGAL